MLARSESAHALILIASLHRNAPRYSCCGPQDEQCHRLVRLLMRAYYEKEHVAIVDCLLDMQVKQANK